MTERNLKDFFNELKLEDDFFLHLTDFIGTGDTAVQQSRVVETMIVDDTWIATIENYLHSVESIVKNPRKFIIDIYNIVPVEKAKRTSSETVRHLAQHTGYIRSIEEDGKKITPSKLLVKEMDEDLLIYENRFVYALINNLLHFVEQRYTAIKDKIGTYDISLLHVQSKFKMQKGDVEYDLNVRVRNEPTDSVLLQKNYQLLTKIENIRKRILVLRGSPFYHFLSNAKPVVPPIMKTNLISMQTAYRNCYRLWLFISSFQTIGFSVEVADKPLPVDTDYYDDLAMMVAMSVKTMVENNSIRKPVYRRVQFKKRPKKRYREIRKVDYVPTFRNVAGFDEADAVNQFFFDNIRDMIMGKEEIKETDIVNMVTVRSSFESFFRSLNNMTNALYDDVIGLTRDPEPLQKETPLQRKQNAYLKQEELYKKYQQLSRLKVQELQSTLTRENSQKAKLERLRFEYEFALEKATGGDTNKSKQRKISSNVNKRIDVVYDAAGKDEAEKMAKEAERQEAVRQREQERLERLAKAREENRKIRELAKQILWEQEMEAQKMEEAGRAIFGAEDDEDNDE